jgi:hypothetical protein
VKGEKSALTHSRQKFGPLGIALCSYQAERGLLLIGRQARKGTETD